MSYTVYMGSFSKRLNSTKQPTYTGWASYSCVFKDGTSLYRPTLRISGSFSTLYGYNYAVLFGKYYYITDVRVIRTDFCEVDMVIDPLASFKSAITGTSAFIEYGFNTFDAGDSSNRFPDNRVPVSENPVGYVTNFDPSGGLMSPTVGCYVMQAVGNDPQTGATHGHHGLATFVMSATALGIIMQKVNSNIKDDFLTPIMNSGLTPQEIANKLMEFSLQNELANESSLAAIQSLIWLPLDITGATSHATSNWLYLGNFATNCQLYMLDENATYSKMTSVSIPWPVNDWRRNCCQLLLYLPFFGTVPIPIDQCIDTSSLGVTWTAEYFSGSISVIVAAASGSYVLYAASTNIAVDMGIGRAQVGASSLIGGTIQALGGVLQMAGGAVDMAAGAAGSVLGLGSIASGANTVATGMQNTFQGYAQTVQPAITCAGTMGGMAAIAQTRTGQVELLYYAPIDVTNFQAKYGHPVMKIGTPASGFCKTRGFSVSIPGNAALAAQINAIMDGGCFIE